MRLLPFACFAGFLACSNSPSPRLIPGGGIGDGEIDGTLNVYVIDHDTETPIAGATVEVGTTQKMTDAKGLATFSPSGPQTITVMASGHVSTVWASADGANVTVPLNPTPDVPEQATLSGTIANWSSITVPQGHIKVAYVGYSADTKLNNGGNNLTQSNNSELCGALPADTSCAWTVVSRTGTVTLTAIIIDAEQSSGTKTIIGYATVPAITVASGVNQSGIVLNQVDAGNLENVTIDVGTPPAALTTTLYEVGIELANFEVVQLPISVLQTAFSTVLVPKPTVYAPDATFRLTGAAQTTSTPTPASIVQRTKLTSTALAAGTWLSTPTNAMVSLTSASFTAVDGASAHQITWQDAQSNDLLEVTIFDPKVTTFDVPNLVAPSSAAVNQKVQALGASFDVKNFSLDQDLDEVWGVSAQPGTVQ